MTRNTFFAAMMFALMAMVSNNTMAQCGRGRGYRIETGSCGRNMNCNSNMNMNCNSSRCDGMDMGRRGCNDGYMDCRGDYMDRPGYRMDYRDGRMGRPDGFREMHGHRWDHDGWMEGYHGRVRHFDDGRWGYYRDGAWLYYDRFYEPDYYFAHPVAHFHGHLLTPTERRIVGATVGVVALAGLISALAH